MRHLMKRSKWYLSGLLFISFHSFAEELKRKDTNILALPAIFCDHMVVQRNQPFIIWGKANARHKIFVNFNHESRTAVAGDDGNWKIVFNKVKTGVSTEISVNDETGKTIHIQDVIAGDVWVCAGQSNMNFMLAADKNGAAEMQQSNNDSLREYRCAMPEGAVNPENSDHSQWVPARGEKLSRFSAVAYYFAKSIQASQHIPVGIIVMSCGNTRAETWTDTDFLKQYPPLHPLLSYWQKERTNKEPLINFMPGKFYDDVVKPVIPFAIKGIVWYQGESNSFADNSGRSIDERTGIYKPLLQALIANWRSAWQQKGLPFYIIQLPNYKDTSGNLQWATIRQAQLDIAKETPHTGLIVTIDLGDSTNIHPNNKMPVGERAARWALTNEYKQHYLAVSGPVIKEMKTFGSKAVLYFTHNGNGLLSKTGSHLQGFEIADAADNNKFFPADAFIKNNTVIVTADHITNPVSVKYAWADNPNVSLFNKENLPASPFIISTKK